MSQTAHSEIDDVLRRISSKQRLTRISFVVILLVVLCAVIMLFIHSNRRAVAANEIVQRQEAIIATATKNAAQVSDSLLDEILALDQKALSLTGGINPTLFVWKDGLEPRSANAVAPNDVDAQVVALLNTRRFLMGSISDPMLMSSPKLASYACSHAWYVVGDSRTVEKESAFLGSRRKDLRFGLASFMTDPSNVQQPFVVGWFMTSKDADKLAGLINKIDHNGPFKKAWAYGPSCSKES